MRRWNGSRLGIILCLTLESSPAHAEREPPNPYSLEPRPTPQLGVGVGWAVPGCDCDLPSSALARAFALWRVGNTRLGVVADHAQFPWRFRRTAHHSFLGGLVRVYSETGPWDIHGGLAFGPAYSPPNEGCSAGPVVFAAQPGVGANVWLAPRFAVGVTAAYAFPLLGASYSCDGSGAGGDARQQVLGVGSVVLELTWGAQAPRKL